MNWKFSIILSTISFCMVNQSESANILVVAPFPGPSHFKSYQPLWENLIKRGHNLTIIAGFKLNDEFQSKHTFVDLKPVFGEPNTKLAFAELRKLSQFQFEMLVGQVYQDFIEEVLKCSEIQAIIHSNKKYDLVIAEMFRFDAIFAFGYKFNAPVIAVSAFPTIRAHHNWIFGNPFSSSYIPNVYVHFTEKMSLYQRIVNAAFNFLSILHYEFFILPRCQTQIEKYFNFDEENMPHIKNVMKNISVTFIDSHYSFGYVKPNLPNIVDVAGIHFTSPTILPENIQKFMDEAEHGIIYLSLGTLLEPETVENFGKIFIRIMENLPQRVVMKWDSKRLPYVPKNFLVQKWIPQVEVLIHPKCQLFITHGGLHSALESLNASVPMIGIPFFGDQGYNLAMVDYFEIGAALNTDNVSEELPQKINEILYNPKYKKNIEKRSQLFREHIKTPMETAMYWVEHVLKHKDISHLKSASTQLTWYEFYSLDVLIILATIFWVTLKLVQFIIRRIFQNLTSVYKK